MIYLDNAATSFPKPRSVIKAVDKCLKKYCANSGRGSHKLAIKTAEAIYSARESVCRLLSINDTNRVVFTQNATHAINLAIMGLIPSNAHVLISDLEHNSVLRPIKRLSETKGVTFSIFATNGDIEKNILKEIRKDTKAIVCTLASNINGKEIPLNILSRIAKQKDFILIVDASQLIGHKSIDLSQNHADALCAPGHKGLFGIQGSGILVLKDNNIEPLLYGGSGTESKNDKMPKNLPERLEAGTLNAPAIVSLRAGIDTILNYELEFIEYRLKKLSMLFKERLYSINDLEIFSESNGIISFRSSRSTPSEIDNLLTARSICVRSGFHCAPLAHKTLGTFNNGLVRVSLSVFNTPSDADALYKALKSI